VSMWKIDHVREPLIMYIRRASPLDHPIELLMRLDPLFLRPTRIRSTHPRDYYKGLSVY
jgi:hypothetical protein